MSLHDFSLFSGSEQQRDNIEVNTFAKYISIEFLLKVLDYYFSKNLSSYLLSYMRPLSQ